MEAKNENESWCVSIVAEDDSKQLESATPIKQYLVYNLQYTSHQQKLDFTVLPAYIHSLQIDTGYNLEFRLYNSRNNDILGTSNNGLLRCTPETAELTSTGNVWADLSGKDSLNEWKPTKRTVILNKFNLHPGFRSDIGFEIELFVSPKQRELGVTSGNEHEIESTGNEKESDIELCNLPHRIQLIVTYYNVWLSKNVYPFGRIGQWVFAQE